ncbi:MAG: DNA mismatch repair protein MutS [Flavobacteriales bacterium]|nr:DNA mismatch repair protein MutS [Flavobacteriales bacterium]MCX7768913.1 DNA mismatch repair protein MutS [Flavobacteriales bacterium]MDW8409954.1 DNA mismatch repair protein MutS [Flavobacteriales bacterium]
MKGGSSIDVDTPLMRQYREIKSRYPDAILLFRIGDFYETFGEDAYKTSQALGIVMTKRSNGAASEVELAGFPHHALDTYLPRLIRAGYRVAICEQLEDPKQAKGIVKRNVTEMVTPGTVLTEALLESGRNNWLAALYRQGKQWGLALADLSTGEFRAAEGDCDWIRQLLSAFKPSEILYPLIRDETLEALLPEGITRYGLEKWIFDITFARDLLTEQFHTPSLRGFGIEHMETGLCAAGAILHYLKETRHDHLGHFTRLTRIDREDTLWLDDFTIRNLELLESPAGPTSTLAHVLDRCTTPMGSRLLKKHIVMPLTRPELIQERLDAVDYVLQTPLLAEKMSESLRQIGDLERLAGRIALRRASPRDYLLLKTTLDKCLKLHVMRTEVTNPYLRARLDMLNPLEELRDHIARALCDNPPIAVGKGPVFREGFHPELDALRQLATGGKQYLLELRQKEAERTGIPSLKIGYNQVFGYYLEVTNTHKSKVPDDWIRKQTLANAERYITPELKEYEEKILGAEEKILALETRLFDELQQYAAHCVPAISLNASVCAELDVVLSHARTARENNYCRPEVNDSLVLDIRKGRHPVIEKCLPTGESYVPNDIYLDVHTQQILIITGPNMSGKSALLRQTALITLMAQIGCYVPAERAIVGTCDKIFTRVGASDNLARGESTFMVEMTETAGILNNITERSLVLLDEIGRGTSTYDGISIATAIAEYLHDHPRCRPRTLFATHYHELNQLAEQKPRIKNFHVSVLETDNQVVFLRKLKPGGSEHSFGIHVAEMAGMPAFVTQRARLLLQEFEKSRHQWALRTGNTWPSGGIQLRLFPLEDPELEFIREELKNLDLNVLSPVDALMKLVEWKRKITK